MAFAVLAFVSLSTTTYAQQTEVADKATVVVKKADKKGSCCASKGAKASCSKDSKAAKATKVSLSSKATKKAGASCSKDKAVKTAQASTTGQKNRPKMEVIKRVVPKTTETAEN